MLYQRLGAGPILFGPVPGSAKISQVGFSLGDLRGPAGRFQIGEPRLRLGEARGRFIAEGAIVDVVLLEKQGPGLNPIAPGDGDGREQALLRGANLDIIGLHVSLPGGRIPRAVTPPPRAAKQHRDDRDNRGYLPAPHCHMTRALQGLVNQPGLRMPPRGEGTILLRMRAMLFAA